MIPDVYAPPMPTITMGRLPPAGPERSTLARGQPLHHFRTTKAAVKMHMKLLTEHKRELMKQAA